MLPEVKLVTDEKGTRFLEVTLDHVVARAKISNREFKIILAGSPDQKKGVMIPKVNLIRKIFLEKLGRSVSLPIAQ